MQIVAGILGLDVGYAGGQCDEMLHGEVRIMPPTVCLINAAQPMARGNSKEP